MGVGIWWTGVGVSAPSRVAVALGGGDPSSSANAGRELVSARARSSSVHTAPMRAAIYGRVAGRGEGADCN